MKCGERDYVAVFVGIAIALYLIAVIIVAVLA